MAASKSGLYRPRYIDQQTGQAKQSAIWWMSYRCFACSKHPAGGRHRESTGTEKSSDALEILNRKRGKKANHEKLKGPSPATMQDLYLLVVAEYERNGQKTIEKLKQIWGFYCASEDCKKHQKNPGWHGHLSSFFSAMIAESVSASDIARYTQLRLSQGAARATINNETAIISKAFKLGLEFNIIAAKPCAVKRYTEQQLNNARQGRFTDQEFALLVSKLPSDVGAALEFDWMSGWRISEVLTRQWHHVDMKKGEVRLEATETKNKKARIFPFELDDPMGQLLSKQWEIHQQLASKNIFCPYVFNHVGDPLFYWYEKAQVHDTSKYFRTAWNKARKETGLAHRIVHDIRRTVVCRLENSRVPRKVAKQLTGHLTDSVYERYYIPQDGELRAGAAAAMQYKKPIAAEGKNK